MEELTMHTKGPWKEVITEGFGPDNFEGLNIESPSTYTVICELAGGLPLHEIQSNASLISAAPDLLEACKAFIAMFSDWQGEIGSGVKNLLDQTKQAISKAEGWQSKIAWK